MTALQTYLAKSGTGTIVVWGSPGASPAPDPGASTLVVPVGLTASALYDVRVATTLSPGRTPEAFPTDTGANLMKHGITLSVPPEEGAAFVTLLKR